VPSRLGPRGGGSALARSPAQCPGGRAPVAQLSLASGFQATDCASATRSQRTAPTCRWRCLTSPAGAPCRRSLWMGTSLAALMVRSPLGALYTQFLSRTRVCKSAHTCRQCSAGPQTGDCCARYDRHVPVGRAEAALQVGRRVCRYVRRMCWPHAHPLGWHVEALSDCIVRRCCVCWPGPGGCERHRFACGTHLCLERVDSTCQHACLPACIVGMASSAVAAEQSLERAPSASVCKNTGPLQHEPEALQVPACYIQLCVDVLPHNAGPACTPDPVTSGIGNRRNVQLPSGRRCGQAHQLKRSAARTRRPQTPLRSRPLSAA